MTVPLRIFIGWDKREPIAYDGAMDRKLLARQLESAVRGSTVAALREPAAA